MAAASYCPYCPMHDRAPFHPACPPRTPRSPPGLRSLDGQYVTAVRRGDSIIHAVGPEFILAAGDVLFLSGALMKWCARLVGRMLLPAMPAALAAGAQGGGLFRRKPPPPSNCCLTALPFNPQACPTEPASWPSWPCCALCPSQKRTGHSNSPLSLQVRCRCARRHREAGQAGAGALQRCAGGGSDGAARLWRRPLHRRSVPCKLHGSSQPQPA